MSEPLDPALVAAPALPEFDVQLDVPDISRWIPGNTGLPGFTTIESGRDGPHLALVALMHGNELAGAIALDRLLSAGVRPLTGSLTYAFANIDAFAKFDPRQPTVSRFIDEDMNRVWDESVLDGPRVSVELTRARAMRPLLSRVDFLLDLHSMLWPSEPLILSGPSDKGRALAMRIGAPTLIVADAGHVSGKRLIDYTPFVDPVTGRSAVLVEAGQHWERATLDVTMACIAGLLRSTGQIDAATAEAMQQPTPGPPRCAEVTMSITAATAGFAFLQPYRGGDVIPRRNTLIALDGETEIRTPHDDCLLVMPSLRPSRGHTAVRLARFV